VLGIEFNRTISNYIEEEIDEKQNRGKTKPSSTRTTLEQESAPRVLIKNTTAFLQRLANMGKDESSS